MELIAWLIPVVVVVFGLGGVLTMRWHRSTRWVQPVHGPASALLAGSLAYSEYGGALGTGGNSAAGGGGDCGGGGDGGC
ncbi:hypothetical protein [Plantactinospora soyae]|uniref:Membrane protein YgcG n=1 Tax=Plantactinospora soyae TaxID=1544732 RepID=A0A927QWN4_9ACTN|nr:hypothetical protein [Plantactinospora soyae]MBE1485762.1 putative membrane protein YgcG [Plantactinospora soyae]